MKDTRAERFYESLQLLQVDNYPSHIQPVFLDHLSSISMEQTSDKGKSSEKINAVALLFDSMSQDIDNPLKRIFQTMKENILHSLLQFKVSPGTGVEPSSLTLMKEEISIFISGWKWMEGTVHVLYIANQQKRRTEQGKVPSTTDDKTSFSTPLPSATTTGRLFRFFTFAFFRRTRICLRDHICTELEAGAI